MQFLRHEPDGASFEPWVSKLLVISTGYSGLVAMNRDAIPKGKIEVSHEHFGIDFSHHRLVISMRTIMSVRLCKPFPRVIGVFCDDSCCPLNKGCHPQSANNPCNLLAFPASQITSFLLVLTLEKFLLNQPFCP